MTATNSSRTGTHKLPQMAIRLRRSFLGPLLLRNTMIVNRTWDGVTAPYCNSCGLYLRSPTRSAKAVPVLRRLYRLLLHPFTSCPWCWGDEIYQPRCSMCDGKGTRAAYRHRCREIDAGRGET